MDYIQDLINITRLGASDIFIIAGKEITYKAYSQIESYNDQTLSPAMTREFIEAIYENAHRDIHILLDEGDDDFSFSIANISRFRVSTYKQRGSLAAVIRVIAFELPNASSLHIPESIIKMGQINKGLVLVTGPAGSGKTTTLACIIDYINQNYQKHIITLEDPIEFLHSHKKSIVSQREIHIDTQSYVKALRASLRQSPDVILLGEMRDYETTNVAITAAETGHIVFSTLHTIGAAKTIDRIIDVFPPNQQRQIAVQLSLTLHAVISQQLVPTIDGTMIPVFEVMYMNPAIRNVIRDNKTHQIDGIIASSSNENMISMDTSLFTLYKQGVILDKTAIQFASNPEMMTKKLQNR